jgi:hypothetical protein
MKNLGCLLDPGPCIASGWHNLVAAVPWWLWIIIGLVLIGIVWKLAGVPGLIAAAFGAGFIAGSMVKSGARPAATVATAPSRSPPRLPFPPIGARPKTLEDLFREGLK